MEVTKLLVKKTVQSKLESLRDTLKINLDLREKNITVALTFFEIRSMRFFSNN